MPTYVIEAIEKEIEKANEARELVLFGAGE